MALTNNQYESVQTIGPAVFSLDWGGLVAIGTNRESKPTNQLVGSLDEFYMFPCALTADDVKKVKDFCGEYGEFMDRLWNAICTRIT